MGVFAYKGRNGRGDLVEGTLEGDDSGTIANQLMNTGITPVEITQSRGLLDSAPGKPGWLKRRLTEQPVSPMDLMLFSRQMYTLLKAGVPIMRALAGLQESTQNPTFSALIQDLRESLDSGRELSSAMRLHPKVFSPFYVSMVQVGEMTGMLDETFIRLFDYLEFERDMRERIKTAMRYPSFVIMAMAVAIIIINLFVIPAFAKVYAGFHAETSDHHQDVDRLLRFHGELLAAYAGDVGRNGNGPALLHQHAGWPLQVGQAQIQAPGGRDYHSQSHAVAFCAWYGAVIQERDADPAGNERDQPGGGQ